MPKIDLDLEEVRKTEKSDDPGADHKVKTNDKEYKVWIAECFNESEHARLDDDENFDDVALAIANKCRNDWN